MKPFNLLSREQKCEFLKILLNQCYHKVSIVGGINGYWRCDKCNKDFRDMESVKRENNYYTPSGFWEVWEWAKEQGWWIQFLSYQGFFTQNADIHCEYILEALSCVDYHTFPDSLIQFLLEPGNIEEWGWVDRGYDEENYHIRDKHPALSYAEGLEKGEE